MIFIDANIYLEFYNSNRPEFKKLLTSIVELKDEILVTSQIVDEVNRNKLGVFNSSVSNTLANASYTSVVLPSHLDAVDSTLIKSWNEERRNIESQTDKNLKQLKSMYADLFSSISSSSDVVSNELTKLFTNAAHYNEALYEKAVIRKQLGNPPGKPKDNMGDQLSWEILLSKIASEVELIIITRDTDYYTQYNKTCFLNSQLHKELLLANKDLNIKCYNKLSDALKDYSSKTLIQSLPSKTELETISKQEPVNEGLVFRGAGITFVPDPPNLCPMCDSRDSFRYPGFSKSVMNRTPTYHYMCNNCSYEFDTFQ